MDRKAIGRRLAKLRNGRDRKLVAEACGISISALMMYERGERIPRDDVKVKLAKYYNEPVCRIFFADNEH